MYAALNNCINNTTVVSLMKFVFLHYGSSTMLSSNGDRFNIFPWRGLSLVVKIDPSTMSTLVTFVRSLTLAL